MRQKKTKTDCLPGLTIFVLIAIKLGPFEKPFLKLELRISSGFPKTMKALDLRSRVFISSLVFGNPDQTLALVYEILLTMRRTLGLPTWLQGNVI